MKYKLKWLFGITVLVILVGIHSCKDEPTTPDDKKVTPVDTTIVEFIQWDNMTGLVTRIESKDFKIKRWRNKSYDSSLVIEFEHNKIPATELSIQYGTDDLDKWDFEEGGKYTPDYTGSGADAWRPRTIGINFRGYNSSTGNFSANWHDSSYTHCKLYKKQGLWVWDFKDVLVTDNSWKGKVSAVIAWKAD